MSRRYSLGEEGDAAVERLERSLGLGPESTRALVASDSVDVRHEVRRRVGEIVRAVVVRPGDDVVRRIHAVVEAMGSPVLVWIEAEAGVGVESEAWRQTLAALNMGRDALAEKGALSLVLAGPVALEQQVKVRAPDLASVMRPMLVLGRRLDPLADAVGPRGGPELDLQDGVGDGQQDVGQEIVDVDDLCVLLRRVAAKTYRQHGVLGLPDDAPKPLASLLDVFVPLDFELVEVSIGEGSDRRGLVSTGVTVDQQTVVESVDPATDADAGIASSLRLPWHGLVILGAPGSGKSTLCRWLAVTIAEREWGRVPIVVEVRDWVREKGLGSVLELAAREVQSKLSIPLSIEDLRLLCHEGRVVLIVDGLDEAVRADDRAGLRDLLMAFSEAHPRVPIVATSRDTGYADAALPAPFQALSIAPFDDAELEEFVRRWYEVVEPHDPEARAAGRAGLVAALAAEPRARELARNPLCATLVALVHRNRAPLPGRRDDLYEMVVEVLLEAWPEYLAARELVARSSGDIEGLAP